MAGPTEFGTGFTLHLEVHFVSRPIYFGTYWDTDLLSGIQDQTIAGPTSFGTGFTLNLEVRFVSRSNYFGTYWDN